MVRDAGPHAIIQAAGLASLDTCAADPELARRINVEGTENIAAAARDAHARLVFGQQWLFVVLDQQQGRTLQSDQTGAHVGGEQRS